MSEFFKYIIGGLGALLFLYIVVRLISVGVFTSYFQSKTTYEKGEPHGKKSDEKEK